MYSGMACLPGTRDVPISMHCAGSPAPATCRHCQGVPGCAHLHPLVCRKPFRPFNRGKRCSTAHKQTGGLKSPVVAKAYSLTEPEPYLVSDELVYLSLNWWPVTVSQQTVVTQDQEYDHVSNAAYWATRPVLVSKRTLEIGVCCCCWCKYLSAQGQ